MRYDAMRYDAVGENSGRCRDAVGDDDTADDPVTMVTTVTIAPSPVG